MPAATRAEREDDRGRHGGGGREGGADPHVPLARTAPRERAGRELGGEARVQAGGNALRQRLLAETGELAPHGLQLVVRHLSLEARVIHVR
jgi:hypothetical protein